MTSKVIPMDAAKTGMLQILERFPEESGVLDRLFQESSSFRSFCKDYCDCLAALRYWQSLTSEEALVMRRAYEELKRELEQEVRQYLEDEKKASWK